MIEDTKENSEKCICKSCPSQNECMNKNEELFYCSRGKSKCAITQKGCICGGCPIHEKFKLTGYYYCEKGKAE